GGQAHRRLAGANARPALDSWIERKSLRREDDDRRAVLKPAHKLALAQIRVAGKNFRSLVIDSERHVEELEAHAGDEHRSDRREGDCVPRRGEPAPNHRALVLAEELLDAPQGDGIDVPYVARDIGHLIDMALMRRMEAMIHARHQPQGGVAAVTVSLDELSVLQKLANVIGRAFDLQDLASLDDPAGADNRVAWAGQDVRPHVGWARAVFQLAHETVVQALEFLFLRVAQIEIGEQAPQADGRVAHPGLLDLAEPAHEDGERMARDAVGEEEVDVFLLHEIFERHGAVKYDG